MNSVSLILFGILDIILELFGLIMCISQGDWDLKDSALVFISSIILDIAKFLFVIFGFIVACCAEKGTTEDAKKKLLGIISLVEMIIILPAVASAVYIIVLILKTPSQYFDFRILYATIFLVYAVLKFASFYGFSELLKAFVKDSPKVAYEHYFPVRSGPYPIYAIGMEYA